MPSNQFDEEFERGLAHLEEGEHEHAIKCFNVCLRLDPSAAEAYGNRGAAKAMSGDLEGAHSDFDTAIRLAPDSSFAWEGRANVLGDMDRHQDALADYAEAIRLDPSELTHRVNRATSLAALKRSQEALEDFARALELDPISILALSRRAEHWAELGEFERSCTDLLHAIELDPGNSELHYILGRARTLSGDPFGALDALNLSVELGPGAPHAFAARGIVLCDLGRYQESVADTTTALQLAEGGAAIYLATIHNSRGIAFRQAGEILAALEDFDRTIALDPDQALYRHNRGLAHGDLDFQTHDLDLARQDQEHALRLDPDHVEARIELGRLHLWEEELESALSAFELAIRADPERAEAHAARGEALEELKRPELAIQAYGEAIRLDPGDPFHLLSRGQAHERQGNTKESLADLTLAIMLSEGTLATAFSSRGVARYNSEDLQGALEDYSRAIELEPDEPIYWRNRAEVWEDLGEPEKAEADEEAAEGLEEQDLA